MALSKEDILLGLPIEDVVQRAENNFVQVFNELEDEVGFTIGLSVDPSSYEMTLELKNSTGDTISTASVDLPIESLVLSASYAKGILTLQLQSGQTLDVDISSLISGLVPDSRTINGKNLKNNVTLTQDDVGDGTSYVRFTPAEKEKLKNIATGANNYQPPTYTGLPTTKGLYKIKVNSNGDVVEATAVEKSDITALGIAGNENATTSKSGLMSSTDKSKLDRIDSSLEGVTADQIGKVKDVTVNGTSVLGSDGVANIVITVEALESGYVSVSSSSLVDCVVDNSTTYKAIKVVDTDVALEVYNSAGNKILTHTVRKDGYLYICVGTTAIACTLRKVGGNSVGSGGSAKKYMHTMELYLDYTVTNKTNKIYLHFIDDRAEPYDSSAGASAFLSSFKNVYGNYKDTPCTGVLFVNDTYYIAFSIAAGSNGFSFSAVGLNGEIKGTEIYTPGKGANQFAVMLDLVSPL